MENALQRDRTYSGPAEFLIINLVRLRSTLQIRAKDVDNIPLLFFAKELGFSGGIGKEKEGGDGSNDRERALYEEDPWPSVVAIKFDLGQTSGQKATKCATEGSGAVEDL